MTYFLSTTILFSSIFIATLILNKSKWANALVWFVIPPALLHYWLTHPHRGNESWFEWAKLCAVITSCIIIFFLRFTPLGDKTWWKWLRASMLGVNIAEAIVLDATRGELHSYINATAGLVLIASITNPSKITRNETNAEQIWNLSPTWIAGYTIWNFTLIYVNINEISLSLIPLLTIPLAIGAIRGIGYWSQARAYSLGLYAMTYFTSYDLISLMKHDCFNTTLSYTLSIIALSLSTYSFTQSDLLSTIKSKLITQPRN